MLFSLSAAAFDAAAPSHALPAEIEGVGITEKLGQQISTDLTFTDDEGQPVTLAKYFNGERPVLLTMVYYNCPSLCNFHLNGLLDVFKNTQARIGVDFDVVSVSMDHTETADLASKKKATYIKALGQGGAEKGWHFLVGDETNVKKLADELGFRFKWNEAAKQFAHVAAAYVSSPTGMISRYLYGIEFSPQTLRLSLVEASNGKIGNIVDQLILFCFQFDPSKNKYTLYAFNLMRIGALLTVILLAAFLVPFWLREKRKGPLGV